MENNFSFYHAAGKPVHVGVAVRSAAHHVRLRLRGRRARPAEGQIRQNSASQTRRQRYMRQRMDVRTQMAADKPDDKLQKIRKR